MRFKLPLLSSYCKGHTPVLSFVIISVKLPLWSGCVVRSQNDECGEKKGEKLHFHDFA